MPMYTYLCSQCSTIFEDFRHMSERETSACSCGAVARQTVGRAPALGPDITGVWRDFPEETYVKSKRHLRELCRRYNMDAPGVF